MGKIKINYEEKKFSPEKLIVPITTQKNYEDIFTPAELLNFVRN